MSFDAVWGARRLLSRLILSGVVLGAAISLSGCVAAVATIGATGAAGMVAQERSIGDGFDDTVADATIKSRLLDEGTHLTQVNVAVNEGHVLLTGRVPKPEDRVTAARVAWSTDNVETVVNEVEVGELNKPLRVPKDAWLSTRVRTALMFEKGVKKLNYGIETVGGTVYLFGAAENQEELLRATERVRQVSGVKRVVSHMRLRDKPSATAFSQPSRSAPPAATGATGSIGSTGSTGAPVTRAPLPPTTMAPPAVTSGPLPPATSAPVNLGRI